jgi:hypothetical protein
MSANPKKLHSCEPNSTVNLLRIAGGEPSIPYIQEVTNGFWTHSYSIRLNKKLNELIDKLICCSGHKVNDKVHLRH